MKQETIIRGDGLTIILDADEIFPDDPGQGTPAIVELDGASATYWFAADQGFLLHRHDAEVELTQSQINWLHVHEDAVTDFLERNGG